MIPVNRIIKLLVFLLVASTSPVLGQYTSNLRWKKIPASQDTIVIDTLTISQESFAVFCGKHRLSSSAYYFDGIERKFVLKKVCSDSLQLRYRVFPINFSKKYQTIDTSRIYKAGGNKNEFYYHNPKTEFDFFSGNGIKKSGSISRGINFGNKQDLSVNSSLNLQLNGRIANNMNLLATLTDKNLPIQPEGNTSQLQDLDKVFIQLYGSGYKIIAGDFWLKKPKGYFLNYDKKVQGLFGQYSWGEDHHKWTATTSGALSKGKFARNVIQGTEGNQGPYRLRGKENEPYIVVLSGTEKVYLDGKLLKRGQDLDYVMNYNTAELTFTSRNMITKDARIVVEFQYTDQNYARSLFVGNLQYEGKKLDFWMNYYTEQDAKNQSLQQKLSNSDKLMLSSIGDSLDLARSNAIDSIGFVDNQVMYLMKDSLGIDSVLVHSVDPDSAAYRATFTEVGAGKGNYVFDRFTANGRVYKWVAPVGGIPQGDYEPYRILVTPKRKAMLSLGARYAISDKWKVQTELSTSTNDVNTFSKIGNKDNKGFANKTSVTGLFKLGKDSLSPWAIQTKLGIEINDQNFQEIERYRGVEFSRDWNVRNRDYTGYQLLSNLSAALLNKKYGSIQLAGQNYTFGRDYIGNRAKLDVDWSQNGFAANVSGSFLKSKAEDKNMYARHIATISQRIGPIRIGFSDNHELNTFRQGDSLLRMDSYQWYEWEAFIASSDSSKNQFKLFYKERYDWKSDSIRLEHSAKARSIGANFNWITNKHSTLSTTASYRVLDIQNTSLSDQDPENTFLGKIDYHLRLWKRALTAQTFYQIGSGLERKKEFLYVKVNAGQGIYTWIDYNNDGIKDLNEFEIAQYPDQANYIRVFTPTDDYVRTYSNEFNQSLFWRPERIWAEKKGILKFISRFSDQVRFRVEKKMAHLENNAYNPFVLNIEDSSLIHLNSTVRNTFFFNRTNPIYGGSYVYEETGIKTLLANGFDSRNEKSHKIDLRWNVIKKLTLKLEMKEGTKKSFVDYTTGRDFAVSFQEIKPELIYQPNTRFRLSLSSRYAEKKNKKLYGGERAFIGDFGLKMKWNQLQKGSLMATFNFVSIHFVGNPFNPIAYEMLESLQPGRNFTWGLQFVHNISKNLQINIHYNGRKSQNHKTVHAGGVEVRAFF